MSRPSLVLRPTPEPNPQPAVKRVPQAGRPVSNAAPYGADDEGLGAFASEQDFSYAVPSQTVAAPSAPSRRPALLATAVVAAAGVLVTGSMYLSRSGGGLSESRSAAVVATGQAQFDSRPTGADVLVDGQLRGQTPLKLTLPVGPHTLEIRSNATSRSLPLTIEAGVVVSQYVELQAAPEALSGRLEIVSDPPGAQVSLDGVVKGMTPLTLDAVEARDHIVSLTRGGSTMYRTVRVPPGSSASVVVSMNAAAPGAVGGYLALAMPFEVQVLEGGRLIGTSSAERLMMPTGRHQLELVNTALQFRTAVDVNIEPGRTASPTIAIPEGTLSVNALPWAEVTINGRSVGTTPLANVRLPIGLHEIVWRHPDLGERRETVTVTEGAAVRVGVNFAQ